MSVDANGCELTLAPELDPQWAEYVERTQAACAKMLGGIATTLG